MKRSANVLAVCSDFLLLSMGLLGALLCPVTALSLPCHYGVLVPVCLVMSLIWAVLDRTLRRVWPVRLAVLAAAGWYVLRNWTALRRTALRVATMTLAQWRQTYSWIGSFPWESAAAPTAADTTVLLLVLAVVLAMILSWAALRRHSLYVALPVTLPLLLVSLAAEDAAPSGWALVLLLAFWLGLTMTRDLRKNRDLRSQLSALLLPCVALAAFAALYGLSGLGGYTRPQYADEAQLKIVQSLASTGSFEFPSTAALSQKLTDLPLDELDGAPESEATVLRVRSSAAGQLYLRGYSLTTYGDNTWGIADTGTDYADYFSQLTAGKGEETVEIQPVLDTSGLLYTVYGLCGTLPDGAALLGDYAISYSDDAYTLSYADRLPSLGDTAYAQSILSSDDYLTVDMTAQQLAALTEISNEILSSLPDGTKTMDEIAEAVADYVRSSAVYDLEAPTNPDGTDFVLYFLQESHRGYCIHFASATTLLLRSLGIPARYVTGYSVTVERANTWVSVSAADAHAWAEYFNGEAWVPLESTPGYTAITLETVQEQEEIQTPEATPEDTPEATSDTDLDEETTPEPSDDGTDSEDPDETAQPDTLDVQSSAYAAAVTEDTARQAPTWLLWLLVPLGLALCLSLRRNWCLRRRQARFTRDDPADGFAAMWVYLLRLERLGVEPTQELIQLAEKARFSREGATEEDCQVLSGFLQAEIQRLYTAASWPRKLVLKYGYVLV